MRMAAALAILLFTKRWMALGFRWDQTSWWLEWWQERWYGIDCQKVVWGSVLMVHELL